MAGQRKVLLHLIKLVMRNDGNRIFLAVNNALRQGHVQLGESNLGGIGAQRFHGRFKLHFGWNADLQALDVGRRVDGQFAVGQVPEAILPV